METNLKGQLSEPLSESMSFVWDKLLEVRIKGSDHWVIPGCPKNLINGLLGYNLLFFLGGGGVYWDYNPFTIHWLNSWDIQVAHLHVPQKSNECPLKKLRDHTCSDLRFGGDIGETAGWQPFLPGSSSASTQLFRKPEPPKWDGITAMQLALDLDFGERYIYTGRSLWHQGEHHPPSVGNTQPDSQSRSPLSPAYRYPNARSSREPAPYNSGRGSAAGSAIQALPLQGTQAASAGSSTNPEIVGKTPKQKGQEARHGQTHFFQAWVGGWVVWWACFVSLKVLHESLCFLGGLMLKMLSGRTPWYELSNCSFLSV